MAARNGDHTASRLIEAKYSHPLRHPTKDLAASFAARMLGENVRPIGMGGQFLSIRKIGLLVFALMFLQAPMGMATVYFVSSSTGEDSNSGLSSDLAFATISKINALVLSPGDEVRFRCGDQWQGESLVINDSGTVGNEITFTSDPPGCVDQPIISGSFGISTWVHYSGNIYYSNLSSGNNAGKFPNGVSQIFANGERLPIGRWPNINGNPDGGYSFIDSQPAGNRIVDNQLPAMSFTGAAVHHKSERWYLFNREVIQTSGTQLTLNDDAVCRDGCAGWGYFITDHLNTLDSEGEWYFDPSLNRIYVYSNAGAPIDNGIEGSILPSGDIRDQAGIVIGGTFPEHVAHIIINNFEVRNWAGNGIRMARLLRDDQNRYITITNNTIIDVGRVGLLLSSFVYDAASSGNGPNGHRGDIAGVVTNNVIDGANLYGIDTHSVESLFEENQIMNIALIDQLTRDGMGCDFTGTVCPITGCGLRVSINSVDQVAYAGRANTIRHNRFSKIGMNGVDLFGPANIVEENTFDEACSTLGDCGSIRTFGGSSFNNTAVYDNIIVRNIIRDTIGNTDGVADPLKDPWGHGIHIDHYSDSTTVNGNTITRSTAFGLAIGHGRGSATANTFFDNSTGSSFSSHVYLNESDTSVNFHGNVIYGLETDHSVLAMSHLSALVSADNNYYFNPRTPLLIRVQEASPAPWTLSEWQANSGLDPNSSESWFLLSEIQPQRAVLHINDSTTSIQVSLGGLDYVDLDQNPVDDPMTLPAFSSKVIVRIYEETPNIFSDDFESGATSKWITVQ